MFNGMKKETPKRKGLDGCFMTASALMLVAGLVFFSPRAQAAPNLLCESAADANSTLNDLITDMKGDINDFIQEMVNFIDLDVSKTATVEILDRMKEYDTSLYAPLDAWWDDKKHEDDCNADNNPNSKPCSSTLPALKAMVRQLSFAKIMQTLQIGAFLDARIINEKIHARREAEAASVARYAPSEMSCQIDAMADGQNKTYFMARALARAFANVDTKRRNNYLEKQPVEYADVFSPASLFMSKAYAGGATPVVPGGSGVELKKLWTDYVTRYCDPARGDQGCITPGSQFGKNRDLPEYLWGDKQTIQMSNPEVRKNIDAAMRTLMSPFAPEPIQAQVIKSQVGQAELMWRRSRDARINAVYSVIAQMISERSEGSNTDTNPIKVATGLPPSTVAINSSYSEMRQTLAKSRFFNPIYAARLVNQPETVEREQGAVDVIQGQVMYDLYKRVEEMVFMEAGYYAYKLDMAAPLTVPRSSFFPVK
jgi:hypothetical protein